MTSQRILESFCWELQRRKTMLDSRFCLRPFQVFRKSSIQGIQKIQAWLPMSPETFKLNMTYAGRKSIYQTLWCMCIYSISRFRFPKPFWRLLKKQIQKRMKTFSSKNFPPWWIGRVCWFGILGVALERKCCLAISLESSATEPQPTDEATGEALPGSLVLRSSHSSVGATTGQYSIATHVFGGMNRTYVYKGWVVPFLD